MRFSLALCLALGGGTLLAGGVRAEAPLPPPVPASLVRTALVYPDLLAGRLSPEEAWQAGDLDAADVLYLFEKRIHAWQLWTDGGKEAQVNRDLAGLLARHAPESVLPPAPAGANVRLWVAEWMRAQKDRRAATLYESILAEVTEPVRNNDLVVLAHFGLARYYNSIGDSRRAMETYLRGDRLYADPFWIADSASEAAWLAMAAGDHDLAFSLYERATQSSDGWLTGMARSYQAGILMAQGKHESARALLLRPVTGSHAEVVRVILLTTLGRSYFRTGEFGAARQRLEEAVSLAGSLKDVPPHLRIAGQVREAQAVLRDIAVWSQRPLLCQPASLELTRNPAGSPLRTTIEVRHLGETPLTIDAPDKEVSVKISDRRIGVGSGDVTTLVVEVTPSDPAREFTGAFVVRSDRFPEHPVTVPVRYRPEGSAPAASGASRPTDPGRS